MRRTNAWVAMALIVGVLAAGCAGDQKATQRPVRMATTTSTANTGLLDYLMPVFEEDTGIKVNFVATGTGKALRHGRDGDVDIVLVHAPPAELTFVEEGFGVERVPIMWNSFVIVGPKGDPAGIGDCDDIAAVFRRLSEEEVAFVSRGDDSGTHKKERAIWEQVGISPQGSWYIEAGQGMGACLAMAGNKLAYTLSDYGTYLSMADKVNLEVVYEGDPLLLNPYALIAINPEVHPHVNREGAEELIKWFTSERVHELIAGFKVHGQSLFHPFDG